MIDQNWARWIKASCAKHFDGLRQTLPLYIDGMDRDTAHLKNFGEFRMDGPRIEEQSMNEYKLIVTLNVLVQHTQDESDLYRFERNMGIFQAAFSSVIDVYRYGTGVVDDQSYLGCLLRDNPIKFNNFGVTDANTRLQQGTLEARYVMELTNG